MSNAICRAAFETRLSAWAKARVPALPIAYQNVAFAPPMTGAYLRAYLLPASTISVDYAGRDSQFKGIFQVSIVVRAGGGTATSGLIEAELTALFPMSLRVARGGYTVTVMAPMNASSSVQDREGATTAVSLRYQADKG